MKQDSINCIVWAITAGISIANVRDYIMSKDFSLALIYFLCVIPSILLSYNCAKRMEKQ